MELHTQIAGIPCIIRVTYLKSVPPSLNADNPDDYWGYVELEYDVCDRNGRLAPWLEAKMTPADAKRIEGEILDAAPRNDDDYYDA